MDTILKVLTWVFWIIVILGVLGLFGYFSEKKCPNCGKRGHIKSNGYKQLDRWRGTKEVTETLASGKTKRRHIQTTYTKRLYFYICENCQHEFSEIETHEMR